MRKKGTLSGQPVFAFEITLVECLLNISLDLAGGVFFCASGPCFAWQHKTNTILWSQSNPFDSRNLDLLLLLRGQFQSVGNKPDPVSGPFTLGQPANFFSDLRTLGC